MGNKIVVLASYTSRSLAYIQAMANKNIHLSHVILFGSESGDLPGQSNSDILSAKVEGLFLPNQSESISETVKKQGWQFSQVDADNINSSEILEKVKELSPGLVIYSGYGGQIIRKPLLSLGMPILHMHSGWLPQYRGSTTLYYSILNGDDIGVSAIVMAENIDQGDIVRRRKYPIPHADVDLDHVYDSAIRANLLLEVIDDFIKCNKLPEGIPQVEDSGEDYFVIHPLLKHIAILKQKKCK